MVTICTTILTFNNSTFCPHTVFMCFVWISEQTATISLYNINWPVFITQKQCVYCAVRTGYLNVIRVNFNLKVCNKYSEHCASSSALRFQSTYQRAVSTITTPSLCLSVQWHWRCSNIRSVAQIFVTTEHFQRHTIPTPYATYALKTSCSTVNLGMQVGLPRNLLRHVRFPSNCCPNDLLSKPHICPHCWQFLWPRGGVS